MVEPFLQDINVFLDLNYIITIRQRYRQSAMPRGRRSSQRSHWISNFVKKVIKNQTVRALGRQAGKHLPTIYNAATRKIKKMIK